jgi:NitT/TauT family transport system substrate-binding protein
MLASLRRAGLLLALALVAVTALTACGGGSTATSASGASVKVQLSWYSNAQNGGWTAAVEEGYFKEAGLGDVTLTPGGPNVSPVQIVAAGRADMAITTAENYLKARAEGIPVKAVSTDFATAPTGIMFKADTGWNTWQDLAGKTWSVSPTSIGWQWVKHSLGIDFTTQNYNGSIAAFLTDPNGITQSFPTNEVYTAQKKGAKVKFLGYTDAGYNPYGDVVIAREDYLAKSGDTVRKVLAGAMKGWVNYMTNVDVATRTNKAIITSNPQLTEDNTWFAWDKQRKYVIGDTGGKRMGKMDDARWSTFVDQLTQLGVVKGSLPAADLYTNDYLPQVNAPTLDQLRAAPGGSYVGQG